MLDDRPPAKRLRLIEEMTAEQGCVIFNLRERVEVVEEETDDFFEPSKRDALRMQQVRPFQALLTWNSCSPCSHVNDKSYAIGR